MSETFEQMESRQWSERQRLEIRHLEERRNLVVQMADSKAGPPMMTAKEVAERLCISRGYTLETLSAKDRTAQVCRARGQIYAAMQKSGFSLSQIGRVFNRDHTSILAGIRSYGGISG